jgi:hypothetical protein
MGRSSEAGARSNAGLSGGSGEIMVCLRGSYCRCRRARRAGRLVLVVASSVGALRLKKISTICGSGMSTNREKQARTVGWRYHNPDISPTLGPERSGNGPEMSGSYRVEARSGSAAPWAAATMIPPRHAHTWSPLQPSCHLPQKPDFGLRHRLVAGRWSRRHLHQHDAARRVDPDPLAVDADGAEAVALVADIVPE